MRLHQITLQIKKKFFNLGPSNEWQKNLPTNIREIIENSFKDEMKELNYL